jgi:hypothetical protein
MISDGTPADDAGTPETTSPTSNSSTTISIDSLVSWDLEAQLLRDGRPLTRPTRWAPGLPLISFLTPPDGKAVWKLYPGSASDGENIEVTVYQAGLINNDWCGVYAMISIDGIPLTSSRPGQLFLPSRHMQWDAWPWSCVMHLPIVSHEAHFEGTHTLLLRAIAR